MHLHLNRPLAFIDIEATGMNVPEDSIVEIAAIKHYPSGEKESYVKRLNPGKPIPEEVEKIHGISDEDVKDAPFFKDIASELFNFLNDADLAGYNAHRLDLPLLVEEFMRCNMIFELRDRKIIDVYRIFTLMEKRDLAAAYKFYCNKELEHAHSAEMDAQATVEILSSQLSRYEELKSDVAYLHDLTRDNDFVDTGRRMIYIKGIPHFNFGKHKGRKVADVFRQEPQYYDWIQKGNFLLDTKHKAKEIRLMMKNSSR